ncbi:hypothetical protein [Flavilitoribacter nigricans]|uniref:Sel1 repeat family protein n=1 Tax=Flavilitoribacter nigricans (strain ATCC 23147 / DSM 23189 / NBRC 102662 / NCIMB 1420 / SS-2) TaxID=1122177 RepID=A0A2D0NAK0_FLAN2|nr:hypothetical protein [Flavilitoribacter nigricans]PHN05408.1 hypothetical protein CRP01_15535 [Flavilitoribacter nigricans DSM 23189 = NBRC 102662]
MSINQKGSKKYDNYSASNQTLGAQSTLIDPRLRPYWQQARAGDINAVFELSRYLYAHEGYSEDLDGALYYKSILVENFPAERDTYTCAVTLMEIGMIYAEKAMREEALTWFRRAYTFIKEGYPTDQGLQLMVEIGFFDFVVESGFSVGVVIR